MFNEILAGLGTVTTPGLPVPDAALNLDLSRYEGVYERPGARYEVSAEGGRMYLTLITCGCDPMLPCRPKLVSDPPQPNMIGIDRFALVKAQIKLIPADRDLKRISCLDCKCFALGTDRHATSLPQSHSGSRPTCAVLTCGGKAASPGLMGFESQTPSESG